LAQSYQIFETGPATPVFFRRVLQKYHVRQELEVFRPVTWTGGIAVDRCPGAGIAFAMLFPDQPQARFLRQRDVTALSRRRNRCGIRERPEPG